MLALDAQERKRHPPAGIIATLRPRPRRNIPVQSDSPRRAVSIGIAARRGAIRSRKLSQISRSSCSARDMRSAAPPLGIVGSASPSVWIQDGKIEAEIVTLLLQQAAGAITVFREIPVPSLTKTPHMRRACRPRRDSPRRAWSDAREVSDVSASSSVPPPTFEKLVEERSSRFDEVPGGPVDHRILSEPRFAESPHLRNLSVSRQSGCFFFGRRRGGAPPTQRRVCQARAGDRAVVLTINRI